jgi:hypothetical protein
MRILSRPSPRPSPADGPHRPPHARGETAGPRSADRAIRVEHHVRLGFARVTVRSTGRRRQIRSIREDIEPAGVDRRDRAYEVANEASASAKRMRFGEDPARRFSQILTRAAPHPSVVGSGSEDGLSGWADTLSRTSGEAAFVVRRRPRQSAVCLLLLRRVS